MLANIRKLRWFYAGRNKIKKDITRASAEGKLKVIIGASVTGFEGWISTDLPHFNILKASHWNYFFSKNQPDNLLAEHVFEHLTEEQVKTVLELCFRWLKPGGCLRIAVPDANHPDQLYLQCTLPPADGHLSSWKSSTLSALLTRCGFRPVPLEYYSDSKQLSTFDLDPVNGPVSRSIQKGFTNQKINGYSSLIIDAYKSIG